MVDNERAVVLQRSSDRRGYAADSSTTQAFSDVGIAGRFELSNRPAIYILRTFRLLVRQFTSPAIVILSFTALIYGSLGNEHDAFLLLAIIMPSGLLTFLQEYRAEKIIEQLASRLAPNALVIRNDVETEIPISELQLGDLVRLRPGVVIPADLLIISESNLLVDESVLTGEPVPRHKSSNGDRELFMGTHVSSGTGSARVVQLGSGTRYGEMVARIEASDVETSFEKGVRDFGLLVARAIMFLVIFVFGGNLLLQRPLFESLLFSLALAVGLTPQMLPVIISVCLSAGARRLAKEKVLVKRLDAIEDLGTISVLCADKTGTLTIGELKVVGAVDAFGNASDEVLRLAYINAVLQESSANSIDDALKSAHSESKIPKKIREYGFSFERRRVSVVLDDGRMICKGSFREVLQISNRIRGLTGELESQISELTKVHENLISEGHKVIAVASGDGYLTNRSERDLIFEGFILITDPPKVDARTSLSLLEELGIELKIVSGDSLASVRHIAGLVGIDKELVIPGSDISISSDDEISRCRVFAEVDPLQKANLVKRLREMEKVVGFLGDGINDAAALRISDVAISVDSAVDVAKSASSIVLLEKDLAVLADGVRIGRRTFENTMKYVRITISASFGNVLSMAFASFFLPFLPMLPTQILLLNFLSDLPALAISGDSVDSEDLGGARNWTMRGIGHFMVLFGIISTAFDLTLFLVSITIFDCSAAELRSSWFALSLVTEVLAILILRTRRRSWRSLPSKTLIALSISIISGAIFVPLLGVLDVVQLPRIEPKFSVMVVLIAAGYALVSEIAKRRTGLMR